VSEVSRGTSNRVQATLRAAGFELVLHIEGYEFPQFHSGWDANALYCRIELDLERCGSLHASLRPIIYTDELECFAQQLRALDQGRDGTATFEHGADEIGMTVRLNSGTGTLEGFLADSASGGRLSFENIDIDQAFVHHARTQLDVTVEAYPVRGTLQIDRT
jgi:hypothetical protein